jgi:excisionase family DNA binding protein
MTKPSRPTDETGHFTTREVASMLGLAVRSIQMMVDRGELEAWKTAGGHRRIAKASVDRWRKGRNVVPHIPMLPVSDLASAKYPSTSPGKDPKQGYKVFLIEDSFYFQNLVKLLLDQKFPELVLTVANDGLAGLAMYGQVNPDVLIVDILLPGVDGGALITTLRSHPQFARSQLLVITSLDEAQRAPYSFALQGVHVIYKPQLVNDLPAALGQALDKLRLEDEVCLPQ